MVGSNVTWYFVAYDQLNHDIFPWSDDERTNNGRQQGKKVEGLGISE